MGADTKKLLKGNEALAAGAIACGCKHYFGYPITPQTEVMAYMSRYLPASGGVYVQAESEVAAINMIYGAAAAGVRALTTSSSPGISLMSEGISYMIGSNLPGVIVNVQRGGPGLGGIQPSQSDYWQATRASGHGDGHLIVLAPSTVQEMAEFVSLAFDLAEKYRNPAMLLSDGLIGQMMEPVDMTVLEPAKAKAKADTSWAANGHQNARPANKIYSMDIVAQNLEDKNALRQSKYEQIVATEQRAEEYLTDDAEVIVVAYGAASRIVRGAVDNLRKDGVKVGLIRPITLWPFPSHTLEKSLTTTKAFLSVELSMGQMIDDIKLAIEHKVPVNLLGHSGGVLPTGVEIEQAISDTLKGEVFRRVPQAK